MPGHPLGIGVHFTGPGGSGGTMDIPVQGITGSPLGQVRLTAPPTSPS